jgi:TonB family protein
VITKQAMPRFPGLLTQSAVGVIEIVIDPAGNVESAKLLQTVHPTYDGLLLAAAKKWQYQPAQLDGTTVKYTKRIQISLAPEKPNVRR